MIGGGGIRYVTTPESEWGRGPRRDEQGDLYRLLASGTAACAEDVVRDRWMDGSASAAAAQVCDHCELKASCLAYALTYDVAGVWGGTLYRERRRMRRASR